MYHEKWEFYIKSKENISIEERNKHMLSAQTIEGLKITGKSNF
jgi:hypothetical protein